MSQSMQKRLLGTFLSVFIFLGCAQMTVQVDVLNSAFWASPQYIDSVTIAKIGDMQQSIRDGRFVSQRETWKSALKAELRKASEEEPPKGRVKPIFPSQVDGLAMLFGSLIDQEYAKAQRKFGEAYGKIADAVRASSPSQRDSALAEANARYTEGVEILAMLGPTLSGDIRRTLQPAVRDEWGREKVDQTAQKAEEKGNQITEGLVGNAGILDDPRAAAVVYAPNEHWTGRFNQTVCRGSFGNSDCAVKMEGLGNFTIKGVRLDATNITQATFSVAREAIQAAAAVYGIPIPNPAAGAGPQAVASPASEDIESPAKRERDASTAIQQMRLARLAMFETVVTQRQAIKANDSARAQAVKTIKSVVEANRKLLGIDGGK